MSQVTNFDDFAAQMAAQSNIGKNELPEPGFAPVMANERIQADANHLVLNEYQQIAEMARVNAPIIRDDHEMRYGVSAMFDISIAKRTGYNAFGRFGNLDFLPRLGLIPLYDSIFDIPAERLGGDVEGNELDETLSSMAGAFDAQQAMQGGGKVFNKQFRSAKQCQEMFENDFGEMGAGGIRSFQRLDYVTANRIYMSILPFNDKNIFNPVAFKPRTVRGYTLKDAPFTDEVLEWLHSESAKYTEFIDLPYQLREIADDARAELIGLCEEALSYARARHQAKSGEIERGETDDYDKPNRRVPDAPKPPDLVCMAHARLIPVQEQDINAAGQVAGEVVRKQAEADDARDKANRQPEPVDYARLAREAMPMLKEEVRKDPAFREEIKQEMMLELGIEPPKKPAPPKGK